MFSKPPLDFCISWLKLWLYLECDQNKSSFELKLPENPALKESNFQTSIGELLGLQLKWR